MDGNQNVDCEKFDRVVLDLLYAELDELTAAAARRHMEHCARCGPIGARLRATREVGVLPTLDPPEDLEARILEAERQAHARLPLRERLGRAVSVMAGYAMRPQLAMAALLVLVFASSLLLLRRGPGDRESMHVTERGVPEVEGEAVVVPVPERKSGTDTVLQAPAAGFGQDQAPRAESRAAAEREDERLARASGREGADAPADEKNEEAKRGAGGSREDTEAYDRAMAEYQGGRYPEAQRQFDSVAAARGPNAASAALFAAQAVRNTSGCAAAAPRFEAVASQYPGISVANEATWQAASCYERLGQRERARQNYTALRSARGYGERAQRALDSLDRSAQAVASRKAKAAPAKAAAPAAKPAAPKADHPAATIESREAGY